VRLCGARERRIQNGHGLRGQRAAFDEAADIGVGGIGRAGGRLAARRDERRRHRVQRLGEKSRGLLREAAIGQRLRHAQRAVSFGDRFRSALIGGFGGERFREQSSRSIQLPRLVGELQQPHGGQDGWQTLSG